MGPGASTTRPTDGRGDFDFVHGDWQIAHRSLADRTDPGCTDWQDFEGTATALSSGDRGLPDAQHEAISLLPSPADVHAAGRSQRV